MSKKWSMLSQVIHSNPPSHEHSEGSERMLTNIKSMLTPSSRLFTALTQPHKLRSTPLHSEGSTNAAGPEYSGYPHSVPIWVEITLRYWYNSALLSRSLLLYFFNLNVQSTTTNIPWCACVLMIKPFILSAFKWPNLLYILSLLPLGLFPSILGKGLSYRLVYSPASQWSKLGCPFLSSLLE